MVLSTRKEMEGKFLNLEKLKIKLFNLLKEKGNSRVSNNHINQSSTSSRQWTKEMRSIKTKYPLLKVSFSNTIKQVCHEIIRHAARHSTHFLLVILNMIPLDSHSKPYSFPAKQNAYPQITCLSTKTSTPQPTHSLVCFCTHFFLT